MYVSASGELFCAELRRKQVAVFSCHRCAIGSNDLADRLSPRSRKDGFELEVLDEPSRVRRLKRHESGAGESEPQVGVTPTDLIFKGGFCACLADGENKRHEITSGFQNEV